MTIFEDSASFQGILGLVHHLRTSDVDVKLSISRKLMRILFAKSDAPMLFAKQLGWQECLARWVCLYFQLFVNILRFWEHSVEIKKCLCHTDFTWNWFWTLPHFTVGKIKNFYVMTCHVTSHRFYVKLIMTLTHFTNGTIKNFLCCTDFTWNWFWSFQHFTDGKSRIFVSFRFYVKSIIEILEARKITILTFSKAMNFDFSEFLAKSKCWNTQVYQNQNSLPLEMSK